MISLSTLAIPFLLTALPALHEDPPNVVLILADDLGFGDLSCYGATAIETPAIDSLAERGVRFTSGYCSASTCTPTRYSLLTGTYAFRVPGTGIAPPNAAALIPAGTVTLASLLRDRGYATAVVGKWHLGLGGEGGPDWNGELKPGPLEIGFDHALLLPTTNDRVPPVFVEGHRVRGLDPEDPLWVGDRKPSEDHSTGITHRKTLRMNWSQGHNQSIHNGIGRIGFFTGGHAARWRDEDLADTWVEESIRWMEAHREQPFFLFFSSHDIHVPRMPHERFQGRSELGYRGDAILQLDACVSELTKALSRLGLTEKTLIVFCSDNGPVLDDGYEDGAVEELGSHRPAGPLRGGKYGTFEGGTRTPFLTCWPGKISPGVSDEIVCTIDLAHSLGKLVGAEIPEDALRDSLDVLDALLFEPGARGREHLVQQDNGRSGNLALRVGSWKLRRTYARSRGAERRTAVHELYDLATDLGETRDVSAEHPERVRLLSERLDEIVRAGRSR